MALADKLKTLFRGDIPLHHLPLEFIRRRWAARLRRIERDSLDQLNARAARLLPKFAKLSPAQLLSHFRARTSPTFWPAVPVVWSAEEVVRDATRIVEDSTWEVMGFGPLKFDGDARWRLDPLTGHDWGLEYHADTQLYRGDGCDVRVLWEVNRFGHAITLGLAYRETGDERFAETFFQHIESWVGQNPYARGANWGCAMEVALRASNLLAAFDIVRTSSAMNEERLALLLQLFDQHGRFIRDNSEFSYVATSNHYLSDVVGLFWIATMMPELAQAWRWRVIGLNETLSEMEKQVMVDGVDFEASTGYHRFVTEMLLMSFLLAKHNRIAIHDRFWQGIALMLKFVRDVTRPDGRMPMIGDCDGSRFIPVTRADADETEFLLKFGAEFVDDEPLKSVAYRDAGIYILRDPDLYLAFNASDCGLNGRGSHGHNDALSIEVSAYGVPFIVDPGSYVYNLDRAARHRFRSTAYHSTVMVDGEEQNSTSVETPFIIGNEAKPRVIEWSSSDSYDVVTAEHNGYARLPQGVTHRRTVSFDKTKRAWHVDDTLAGTGEHDLQFLFHFAPEVEVVERKGYLIGRKHNASLIIAVDDEFDFERVEGAFAINYGQRQPTTIGIWSTRASTPFSATFALVPVGPDDDEVNRLELARRLAENK